MRETERPCQASGVESTVYHMSNGCRFHTLSLRQQEICLPCDVQGSSIVTYDSKCIFHVHGKDLYNPSNNVCEE